MDSKTLRYIIKRALMAVVTLWAVITVTFFVMKAVPGDPFASEKAVSPAAKAALEAKYGLDKPIMEQYTNYLTGALHFDFGPSLKQRGRDVTTIIVDGMRTSAKLGIIALILATVTGILLGALAALRRNSVIDKIIMRSCKAAVKAGDKLTPEEIDALISQLKECVNPFSCPHGRPTFIRMTRYEIEKLFKRV